MPNPKLSPKLPLNLILTELAAPLQGGIAGGSRTIGEDDGFTLDACASRDPDDPLASCDAATRACGSGLALAWTCTRLTDVTGAQAASVDCDGLAPPPSSQCAWDVEPGALAAGSFHFTALVSKPDGEAISPSVVITIETGALPAVSIRIPAAQKQNPTSKMPLFGQVRMRLC